MSAPAVQVQGLGKQYGFGSRQDATGTFYDALSNALRSPFSKRGDANANVSNDSDTFWALRDVSFDVQPGEVVGIIGRNGAGKSTLLKILSRITAPTEGRVEVRGRLASLLEVGTGFHPELSGRENIYLNGAILGMTRREIAKKFDEIVAFAEVEKFIDTPVKRYSSGMYVRLAFAVAAHLDTDILIVDEVLAVGDLAFQRKCMGRMSDVAREGRTVLFVSHNLQAVKVLCNRALMMEAGCVAEYSEVQRALEKYSAAIGTVHPSQWIAGSPLGERGVYLDFICTRNSDGELVGMVESSDGFQIEMLVRVTIPTDDLCIGFDMLTPDGDVAFRSYQTDVPSLSQGTLASGVYRLGCLVPGGQLNSGKYHIAPRIGVHNKYWIVNSDPLLSVIVNLSHGKTRFWASLTRGSRPGAIAPILDWHCKLVREE